MNIYTNINEAKNIKNPIVTIGTFDGIHIGHKAVFDKMKDLARKFNGETVVMTFYPHPRQVLNIDTSNLRFICTQEDKMKKFEEIGIDNVIVINFTKEFSRTPSDVFIKNYIVEKLHPAVIVVGYDHHFGKNRIGDFDILYDMGKRYGFSVERIKAQDVEHIAVSSTKIRHALASGNVAAANKLLGYRYSLCGTVVRGNMIGRTIGFPTANIDIEPQFMLLTNAGVYACKAFYDGKEYNAMANIGRRPTIGDVKEGSYMVEVNIFDFDADIYGQKLRINLVDRIRDEIKFANLDELKQQLTTDRKKAKEILGNL